MTHIRCRRPFQLCQDIALEGQQSKHMVNVATHRPRAPGAPGPNRWRDVVDDYNVGCLLPHPFRDPMGEFGAVDDDQNVGLESDSTCGCLSDAMHIKPKPRQYLAKA